MKWKFAFLFLLILSTTFAVQAQTRPTLVIRPITGGLGSDGDNITGMLANHWVIRNYFIVTEGIGDYTISGQIRQEGLGSTLTVSIARGTTVLGTETLWYRDIAEVHGYMNIIATNLTRRVYTQIAHAGTLPQYEAPPVPIPVPAPAPAPAPAARTPSPAPSAPSVPVRADITDDEPIGPLWYNRWLYFSASLGYIGAGDRWFGVRSYSNNEYAGQRLTDTFESAIFGIQGDVNIFRWLNVGLGLQFFDMNEDLGISIPLIAKIGYRFERFEAFFNLGFDPMFGVPIFGATAGYNLGSGIAFVEILGGFGSIQDGNRRGRFDYYLNEWRTPAQVDRDFITFRIGYRIGIGSK